MKIAVDAMGVTMLLKKLLRVLFLHQNYFLKSRKFFLVGSPTAIEPLLEKEMINWKLFLPVK